MITPPITIDYGHVTVNAASGEIWMTQHEIARMFEVFVPAIGANIRSIFKNEILNERRMRRVVRHKNGNETTLSLQSRNDRRAGLPAQIPQCWHLPPLDRRASGTDNARM